MADKTASILLKIIMYYTTLGIYYIIIIVTWFCLRTTKSPTIRNFEKADVGSLRYIQFQTLWWTQRIGGIAEVNEGIHVGREFGRLWKFGGNTVRLSLLVIHYYFTEQHPRTFYYSQQISLHRYQLPYRNIGQYCRNLYKWVYIFVTWHLATTTRNVKTPTF